MNYRNSSITFIQDVAKHVNRKVNLLGAVLEFSFPRKSQGTDYVSVLKIVDESRRSPELSVNMFNETSDNLPHVRSHGDLILLKNVMIKEFDGEVYAVFYKKFSSFALYDGKQSKDIISYQASPRFVLLGSEEDFILRARYWCHFVQFNSGNSEYLLSLKDILDKRYFDLVCEVLHVAYEASKDVWMLYVWDGTDAPPLSLHGNLKDERQNPLPLRIEPSPLHQGVLCKFHRVGTVLRVTTDQAHEKFGLHFEGIGKWVRIRNMTSEVSSGMWHGRLTPSSRVRLLSDKDNIVIDYRRRYRERIVAEHGRLPVWSSPPSYPLTVIDYKDVGYATLMDILTHEEVNAMFCSVVRVVAMYPSQANDCCPPDGSSVYRMRLTLEDPTARMHAFLCGEEWVKFFEGYPPIDLLSTKMKQLLGIPEDQNVEDSDDILRNPPWIRCCIRSMIRDASGNRLYEICRTRLVMQ